MINRRMTLAGMATMGLAGMARPAVADGFPIEALKKLSEATNLSRNDGRYLLGWKALAMSKVQVPDMTEQWAAFLGDEAAALVHAADMRQPVPDLTGAKSEDAIAAIVAASRGRRVVMLNEAHVASRHRMFLERALRALRGEGFTHLAAETFLSIRDPKAPQVETLKAGDQLKFTHGYYIADPAYAEAVRVGLELGYQLVPYEERPDQHDAAADPSKPDATREQSQAINLADALKRWPDGRFVVHAGYGHIETRMDLPGGGRFAGRFIQLTGIEPLIVSQASVGAFGPHAPDSAATQSVLRKFRPTEAIIVRKGDGRALAAGRPGDLAVFHPSLPDVRGRPGWLAAAPGRRRAPVRLPEHAGPTLAQAIHASDQEPAIPADQYLLTAGAREAVFHLRPGRYRVRLETEAGFTPVREIAV